MGTVTLWDRIWPWLRHPLSTAAATIAFRYLDDHPTLEIRLKGHVVPDARSSFNQQEGSSDE